jgi:ketosteroid isomerase-like protein
MSEENVELVRRAWEAWQRGDIDAQFEFWDRDIVWDLTHFREWPESTYDGHEGVRRFLSEWLEVWDEYEVGLDETLATPDGRVMSLAWQRGKGRESGLVMEMEWAQIYTFQGHKITRIDNYDDRDAALKAAGLSE